MKKKLIPLVIVLGLSALGLPFIIYEMGSKPYNFQVYPSDEKDYEFFEFVDLCKDVMKNSKSQQDMTKDERQSLRDQIKRCSDFEEQIAVNGSCQNIRDYGHDFHYEMHEEQAQNRYEKNCEDE